MLNGIKVEVTFIKASKACKKVFKSCQAFDKWFDKNEGYISNVQYRAIEA